MEITINYTGGDNNPEVKEAVEALGFIPNDKMYFRWSADTTLENLCLLVNELDTYVCTLRTGFNKHKEVIYSLDLSENRNLKP